jgi:hypothetical protein
MLRLHCANLAECVGDLAPIESAFTKAKRSHSAGQISTDQPLSSVGALRISAINGDKGARMKETCFNLFLYGDDLTISKLGVAVHELEGSDRARFRKRTTSYVRTATEVLF